MPRIVAMIEVEDLGEWEKTFRTHEARQHPVLRAG